MTPAIRLNHLEKIVAALASAGPARPKAARWTGEDHARLAADIEAFAIEHYRKVYPDLAASMSPPDLAHAAAVMAGQAIGEPTQTMEGPNHDPA